MAPSFMESPANAHPQQYQGLNQDSPLGFDLSRWNDPTKGPQMDMFHIASPPLTPSGGMARSPSSYNNFGTNSSIKRPPLWPMDRAPAMPFPRQTPTPSQSSKVSNLQHIPCKFFKSGACTAGKNCSFSHSRDPPSENFVCKYFLKGNCKFGAKCSLSHSFLAPDRKTSALLPGPAPGSLGSRSRLERRASSGAILNNNFWPTEPLSPPYGSSLPQQNTLHFNSNNVEFTMGRSPSHQGFLKPIVNRTTAEGLRGAQFVSSSSQEFIGGNRSPFSEDDYGMNPDSHMERAAAAAAAAASSTPLELIENRVRQHLAAPLPIRQRSLPDIFRLTPLSQEGGALATSPFHQPGNKALFLSVSCEGDTNPSTPLRLHSIPELHDLYNSQCGSSSIGGGGETLRRRSSFAGHDHGIQQDDYSDSDDDGSLEQGFLPSSLNDLLTTHERQRRQSRQEDVDPRSVMLPSPASGSLRDDKEEDEIRFRFGSRSSVSGVAQGMSSDARQQFQCSLAEFDQQYTANTADVPTSPLAMLIPGGQISSYTTQKQHQHQQQQRENPSFEEGGDSHAMSRGQGSYYKERNSSPDPFCPFLDDAAEQEVQFAMDDDLTTGEGEGTSFQRPRAGLFETTTTTTTATKELNRAVGSNSVMEKQRQLQLQQQKQQGTMTPVSLMTRDDDDDNDSEGVVVSLAGIDFSSLSISDGGLLFNNRSISGKITPQQEWDSVADGVGATLNYAGIPRTNASDDE
ncbi:hypothetical protein BGZ58_001148 [Dissophora ornata]|nr:hypothetical protein BGZ58_001148 [Dissophora ornata]